MNLNFRLDICFLLHPCRWNGIISRPRISKLYSSTAEMFVVCCYVKHRLQRAWCVDSDVTRHALKQYSILVNQFSLLASVFSQCLSKVVRTHWISCCLQTFLYHFSLFDASNLSFYASLWETHKLAVSQLFVVWALQ